MKDILKELGITPGPWWNEGAYLATMIEGKRPNGEIIGCMSPSIGGLFKDRLQNHRNAKCAATSPKMLKAIINFKTDMYGRGCDCDPEMVDLLERHLSVFTEIIEDISGKTWEELIK